MKRSHVQLLFALMFIVSVATVTPIHNVEAGSSQGDEFVGAFGDDGGVAPHQGEPDVGQTNGDPAETEPGLGDVRLVSPQAFEGLLSWTSAFWVARLFGIGI